MIHQKPSSGMNRARHIVSSLNSQTHDRKQRISRLLGRFLVPLFFPQRQFSQQASHTPDVSNSGEQIRRSRDGFQSIAFSPGVENAKVVLVVRIGITAGRAGLWVCDMIDISAQILVSSGFPHSAGNPPIDKSGSQQKRRNIFG
jgi:hypothetical protein